MSHPYSDALAMRTSVSYIIHDTSSHGKTGYIITLAQSKERNLLENEGNT